MNKKKIKLVFMAAMYMLLGVVLCAITVAIGNGLSNKEVGDGLVLFGEIGCVVLSGGAMLLLLIAMPGTYLTADELEEAEEAEFEETSEEPKEIKWAKGLLLLEFTQNDGTTFIRDAEIDCSVAQYHRWVEDLFNNIGRDIRLAIYRDSGLHSGVNLKTITDVRFVENHIVISTKLETAEEDE